MIYALTFTHYYFDGVLKKKKKVLTSPPSSVLLSNTSRFCWEGLAAALIMKGYGVFKGLFLGPTFHQPVGLKQGELWVQGTAGQSD